MLVFGISTVVNKCDLISIFIFENLGKLISIKFTPIGDNLQDFIVIYHDLQYFGFLNFILQ